jgi:hypothetical protein
VLSGTKAIDSGYPTKAVSERKCLCVRKIVLSISNLIASVLGVITFICGVIFIVRPIYDQIYSWLKTGYAPVRDLHWAVAPVSCSATNYQPKGFRGMDLCREDYVDFTGWIGLDRILN